MIKTVFLDIDNTLIDFSQCARLSMMKAFSDFGLTYSEEMFPVFTTINNGLWEEIERGTLTRDELHEIRWTRIFERLGIIADGKAFEKMFLQYLSETAGLIPGAIELLAYLAPRYTLCLASNASQAQQMKRLKSSGILPFVQKVFLSESLGVPKPEKEFFDLCFAQLPGATPEESIMIGDSLTADMKCGATCGIKTCWFNPEKMPTPPEYTIDFVVHSLDEIKNFL